MGPKTSPKLSSLAILVSLLNKQFTFNSSHLGYASMRTDTETQLADIRQINMLITILLEPYQGKVSTFNAVYSHTVGEQSLHACQC